MVPNIILCSTRGSTTGEIFLGSHGYQFSFYKSLFASFCVFCLRTAAGDETWIDGKAYVDVLGFGLTEVSDKPSQLTIVHDMYENGNKIGIEVHTSGRSVSRLQQDEHTNGERTLCRSHKTAGQEGVSGTTGISGAVDAVFILDKRQRSMAQATLICTGRDVEYRELELSFSGDTCTWKNITYTTPDGKKCCDD